MKQKDHKKTNVYITDKIHYEGVFTAIKKDGTLYYRASLTHKTRHISLGSHTTPSAAHEAYLEGQRLLHGETAIMDYTSESPLAFEKWVILINFRDNGIYFGTPIYVGQKMFYYYLSPTHVLKFDMDDLFYFASHKIMCRGNHYFVADYGMQVNIASRFNIKNYAVPGRDFRFLNGDSTDFRRENLEITNTYHGVIPEHKNGQYYYTVRIHIVGNYLVGKYATEWEAAIAYNKAIDVLRKQGIRKNFIPNYIEGISPSKYADIYTEISISPKLYTISGNNQSD